MANETKWNFDEKNIQDVRKRMKEKPIPDKAHTMLLDESGNSKTIKILEESRKKCAKDVVK